MHRSALIVSACVLLGAGAQPAAAQGVAEWLDRGYANINLGFESTSGTLTDSTTFTLYDESGTKSVEQAVDSGAFFDFSVGSRVWRNVSVGLGYHREGTSSAAAATALVPHPLFFNASRPASAAATGLDRTERAFHILFGYMIPIDERFSIHVTAGPSFFRLKQDVIADLAFTEQSFPFSSVDASAIIEERSDSAVGFNIGADVTYQFYETSDYRIGGGMFVRWAGATAKIRVLQNEIDSDLGGVQIGFGARVRF